MNADLLKTRLVERLVPPGAWRSTTPAARSDFDLNPGAGRWVEGALKPAAVLIPLIVGREDVSVLLTRRADSLLRHTGQIAFPGGRLDKGETATEAALREAQEEVALDPASVQVLGLGDAYETGTGYLVTPVVGWIEAPGHLTASPAEVAEVFETPWDFLMDPANHVRDSFDAPDGAQRWFWTMTWQDRRIWGATAGIIRSLHLRLYGHPADEAAA